MSTRPSLMQEGIIVVDRCPLDPLTFCRESADRRAKERYGRARRVLRPVCPGSDSHRVEGGHIIHLSGEVNEIRARLLSKHKKWKESAVQDLIEQIGEVFTHSRISKVDTRNRPVNEVVKQVATVIHREEYCEVDLHAELKRFAGL